MTDAQHAINNYTFGAYVWLQNDDEMIDIDGSLDLDELKYIVMIMEQAQEDRLK